MGSTSTVASDSYPGLRSVACTSRADGHAEFICWCCCQTSNRRRRSRSGWMAIASWKATGRPTVRLTARDLLERALDCAPQALLIPAHAWTPWYGIYGSKAGFDGLEECFGDLAPLVRAVESGLSSDPAMNRAVPELDGRAVVSFSDAHSPAKAGTGSNGVFGTAFVGRVGQCARQPGRSLHRGILPGGREIPLQRAPQVRRRVRHG